MTGQVIHSQILVADDDRDILMMLKIGLEKSGFNVLVSYNGEKIYEIIAKNHPDIILLDITMDGISGCDICRKLKTTPETMQIPVIIISANNNGAKVAKECGADNFMAKPFHLPVLKKMILDILHR